jgi:chromatin remodeling complex protein RSC6
MAQKKNITTAAPSETIAQDPVVDAPTPVEDTVEKRFEALLSKVVTLTGELKEVQGELKALQKEYSKVVKTHAKKGKKVATKRAPSGFAKPCKISKELCAFFNLPEGSEKARTDITKMLNQYIKENKLQDANDRRNIVANEALCKLMNLKPTDQLNYFNLQTYIKQHFNA